jgi:putative membrane protein
MGAFLNFGRRGAMFSWNEISTKLNGFSLKQFLETKTGKAIYVACVTVTFSAVGSWAVLAHQDSPSTTSRTTAAKNRPLLGDAHFAKEAAQGGMAEVKLGQLAEEKGSNDTVKTFGRRMVDDHSKAGDKLKEVASRESITLPTDISAKDQATYDRLAKLHGTAFDRAYARDMVKDHEADVAAFQREANGGKDDSLKSFASETLPTLQDHLKQAKEMMKTVGGTTAAKGSKTKANSSGR